MASQKCQISLKQICNCGFITADNNVAASRVNLTQPDKKHN